MSSPSSSPSAMPVVGWRFCITSSPRPPGTRSANTSRKCLATPLKVRSMASSLRASKVLISSWILWAATSSSCFRAARSVRCAVKEACWSRARLFTPPKCLATRAATLLSAADNSLTFLCLWASNASAGSVPRSRIRRVRFSALLVSVARCRAKRSRAAASSAAAAIPRAAASVAASLSVARVLALWLARSRAASAFATAVAAACSSGPITSVIWRCSSANASLASWVAPPPSSP
mmetsp:Transcript_14649/g.39630  ORF Transcript_14649/g.39630 Transcript_14649/m.39630 type:complete len:235 (-) Transcript_14649:2745-3449(-)